MSYIVKLASTLPKAATLNGLDARIAEEMWTQDRGEHLVTPVVVVAVLDLCDTRNPVGKDRETVLQPSAVEVLRDAGSLLLVRSVMRQAAAARLGGDTLPFDLSTVLKRAFANVPRTHAEIDEEEAEEQENMTELDELRRHLANVHGCNSAGMTEDEVRGRHCDDHQENLLGEGFDHEEVWWGWTRADLEVAAIAGDDSPHDEDRGHDPELSKDLDDEHGDRTVEFSGGH